MKTGIATTCLTVLLLGTGALASAETQHAVVTIMWEKVLWERGTYGEGEGEWGIHIPWEDAEPPRGQAVDNQGRIIVCDSYRDRILVFSPEGERLTIIDLEGHLAFPMEILVDEFDTLYVYGTTPKERFDKQILLKPTSSGWDIAPVDLESIELAPNAQLPIYREEHRLVPLAFDGLRWFIVYVDSRMKCQLVDSDGKAAGFLPDFDAIRDERGLFYQLGRRVLRIFNASGDLVAEVDDPVHRPPYQFRNLLLYDGRVYVESGYARLLRFAEDGTLEEEVVADAPFPVRIVMPFASPRADFLYQRSAGKVIRWEYKPVPSTPGEQNDD